MSQSLLPENAFPSKLEIENPTLPSLKGYLRPKLQEKDKVTNILKGYYANVTLKNCEKLARLDSQCLYVSIIGEGNGIPDHAPILSIRVKNEICSPGLSGMVVSTKSSEICLSIRSQCGWKQTKQDNLTINFDLKVDCIGKSHRAPTFLLEFELFEKRNSEKFVLSQTEILVRAVTKIPKNAIVADLLLPEEFTLNDNKLVQFIDVKTHQPISIDMGFGVEKERTISSPTKEENKAKSLEDAVDHESALKLLHLWEQNHDQLRELAEASSKRSREGCYNYFPMDKKGRFGENEGIPSF